jgi:hypothetical protein
MTKPHCCQHFKISKILRKLEKKNRCSYWCRMEKMEEGCRRVRKTKWCKGETDEQQGPKEGVKMNRVNTSHRRPWGSRKPQLG